MKLLRVLLILPGALLLGLPACTDCGPFKQQYIDVNEALVVALRTTGAGSSPVVLSAGETVTAPSLRLDLRLFGPAYSTSPDRAGGFAALACEPADPQYKELVDSLRVSSRYAFDAAHPAGAALNDLIQNADGSNLASLLIAPRSAGALNGERLKLTQPPTSAGPQQFRVRIHLTNGEVYTAETPVLSVIP